MTQLPKDWNQESFYQVAKTLAHQLKDKKLSTDDLEALFSRHRDFPTVVEKIAKELPQLFDRMSQHAEQTYRHLKRIPRHKRAEWVVPLPNPIPTPILHFNEYPALHTFRSGSMESKSYVGAYTDGFHILIKQYHPEAVELSPQEMFRHQERMCQRLNQIPDPRVEEIFDHFLLDDGTYIQIKPYLKNISFWKWMESCPDRRIRIKLLQQLGAVLQLLHDNNISHMDLKPDQLLLLFDPDAPRTNEPPPFVLIDYDFSMIDGKRTLTVGSAPYYAPEQFDEDYDDPELAGNQADVYAFCVITHRVLAEIFPFGDGRTEPSFLDALKEEYNLESLNIPYPPLQMILERGLSPDPEHRPSLQEILSVLHEPGLLEAAHNFEELKPLPQTPRKTETPSEPTPTHSSAPWMLIFALIGLCLIFISTQKMTKGIGTVMLFFGLIHIFLNWNRPE